MMHPLDIRTYHAAADLPATWDALAPHPFMRTPILHALERTQPCGQRYHMATGGEGVVLAVTYRHRLHLLAGRGRRLLPVPVRMVGIPCSVSYSGYHAHRAPAALLARATEGAGLTLVMNAHAPALDRFTPARTLPSWMLPVRWPDFDGYLDALRSPYRRRIRRALQQRGSVTTRPLPRAAFHASHYALYEEVHARSRYKLEKLSLSFFQQFPAELDVFEAEGQPIGFVQTVQDGDTLAFIFGGMAYALRERYDLYWNMLLHVIAKGIELGCREIHLGQTAGSVKARMGAMPEARWVHARHPSRFLHAMLGRMMPVLAYQGEDDPGPMRVFRTQEREGTG